MCSTNGSNGAQRDVDVGRYCDNNRCSYNYNIIVSLKNKGNVAHHMRDDHAGPQIYPDQVLCSTTHVPHKSAGTCTLYASRVTLIMVRHYTCNTK